MNRLSEAKCEACRVGAPRVEPGEADDLLQALDDWELIQADGVDQLVKSYRFTNFAEAMEFAAKVGKEADREDHHPLLIVEWGKVSVNWWTHKIGGLHMNDFIMAAKTDLLYHPYQH